MEVVIIGGGVIGMLTARELQSAGASVTILERQALGQESSWAGGGILSPINPWQVSEPITRLCRWSQSVYPDLAEALNNSSGIDPEWQPSGMLFRRESDSEALNRWAQTQGVEIENLEAAEIARHEPGLTVEAGETATLLPRVAHIRNPRLLAALSRDIRNRGIRILTDQAVVSLDIRGTRVHSADTASGKYQADHYVVTAGAWSGQLARLTGAAVDVEPVRGQMLVFRAVPDLLRHMVLEQGRYLIPRRDGHILAGSTVEYAGFDKDTTEAARAELEEFAYRLLPTLRDYPIERHWAGLRPGSQEGIPYIGAHPEVSNLYFNCGHFRNGLIMGPASARLLGYLLLERSPILPP